MKIPSFSPGDVFKHEDDAHHVKDQEEYLHHHPVQSLPLDLNYFSIISSTRPEPDLTLS